MTVASRLALAMIVLVVVTSCVVSVFAWYFIEASARGVSTAIVSAALAGSAIASVFGIVLAIGDDEDFRRTSDHVDAHHAV